MLFGTRVTYVNPDNAHQEEIIVSRDKGHRYNFRLDNGMEITVLPTTLSLSKSVDPEAPVVPEKLIQSIKATIGDTETTCFEQPTNLPLDNPQKELLHWHIRLGHISLDTLCLYAKYGILPRHLANVKLNPLCACCVFGRAHKKTWRTSSDVNPICKPQDNKPGDCVSVDQIVSGQLGFVPQGSGELTGHRIQGATVFVDNASHL